jgi:IrrE N-terminal-like domain
MRKRKQKRWTSAAARRLLGLAGNPPTVEKAAELVATRLLEGICCPPTDLEALRTRLNVSGFEPIDGLPISGELRKDGDGFKIVYSASLQPGRRRFTIAHELAHAVFETTGPNCPRYGNELERICDLLASEILLPRKILVENAGASIQPVRIFDLARIFETSLMATALRCHQVFGISIFHVENARLVWGYGAIRHQRDIEVHIHQEAAITQAMEGVAGETKVYLNGRDHVCSWASARGQRRALFVLQPRSSVRTNSANLLWSS